MTFTPASVGEAGADEVLVTRRCHDQQLQRLAIPPVPGQRFDQKTGALQVVTCDAGVAGPAVEWPGKFQ